MDAWVYLGVKLCARVEDEEKETKERMIRI